MLAAVLVFGLGAALSAVAQTPNLPLPALPLAPIAPEPVKPSATLPGDKTATEKLDTKATAAPQPVAAPAASSTDKKAQDSQQASTAGAALPTIPKAPPSDDSAGFGKEAADGTPVLPNVTVQPPKLPGLALPTPSATPATATPSKDEQIAAGLAIMASVDEQEATAPKSWETKLAPLVKIPKLGYHYKRQILPDLVYRDEYTHDNMHLPPRTTREDYRLLLFKSIAKGDMVVTRALLNAGVEVNAANEYGETPLAFAERMGDERTVALLQARGGR